MTVMIHPDAEASPGAGRVAELRVSTLSPASLQLDWQPSCSTDDDDYAVYSGEIGHFTGYAPELCSTAGMTTATVPLPAGNRYYIVVPSDGASEGSHGKDSNGLERSVGVLTCGMQKIEPGACMPVS